jgi:hypothetical protein
MVMPYIHERLLSLMSVRLTGIQVVAHAKNHADGNYLHLYHIIGR